MPATISQARAPLHLAGLPPHLARQVWRGGQLGRPAGRVVPTGQAALDAELPGGGWPLGGLTELLVEHQGIGEMRLLVHALRAVTADGPEARHVALIAPPYLPYAPALAAWGIALERVIWIKADARQALWAAEQTLKHEGVGAVLVWLPKVRTDALRRLQVLAQEGQSLVFLLRPAGAAAQSSPAPLRILCRTPALLEPRTSASLESAALRRAKSGPVRAHHAGGFADDEESATDRRATWLQLDIFKRRGPALAAPLRLCLPLEVPTGWLRIAALPSSFNSVPRAELPVHSQEKQGAMNRSQSNRNDAGHEFAHSQEKQDALDRRNAAGSAARSAQAAVTVTT